MTGSGKTGLQTDADRARVVEGFGEDKKRSALATVLKKLGPRWFVVRDARDTKLTILNPRWAMIYLRGPLTARELTRLRASAAAHGADAPCAEPRGEPRAASPSTSPRSSGP